MTGTLRTAAELAAFCVMQDLLSPATSKIGALFWALLGVGP